ncbi:hypothetical protein M0802_002809 [Mischocyttarus mexicanus]|nr:hypothetical protein M0802_002809 [Mischocyttarus mexicanus]
MGWGRGKLGADIVGPVQGSKSDCNQIRSVSSWSVVLVILVVVVVVEEDEDEKEEEVVVVEEKQEEENA